MNFKEFQEACKRTENPALTNKDKILNWVLGLNGEVGEVTEIIKKAFYHDKPYDLQKLKLEVSDVMYYVAAFCTAFGFDLEEVCQLNVDKLLARHPNGFSGTYHKTNNDHENDGN